MRKIIVFILCFVAIRGADAQEKDTSYWQGAGSGSVNFSQVSLSNWSAGGDGSLAFNLMFDYKLDYKKEKHLWQNYLELAYGMSKTVKEESKKTNDKIYFSSLYGYLIAKNFYISGQFVYNTQFANGYDYSVEPKMFISQFMSPGYLTVGAGFTWVPKKWITVTFSPIAWQGTFVRNTRLLDEDLFRVKPGKHCLSGVGGNFKLEITYEFLPNMTVYSRLGLFSDYLHKPQNIDVKWDTQLTMKINKWFAENLNLNMIYDDDVMILQKDGHKGPRLQVKEVLGVGFRATF